MPSWDTPSITIAEAGDIAGLSIFTARSWFQRGWLQAGRHDKRASVAGATAYLTGRRVLQLTIAAELASLGIHPKSACEAAWHFTDAGDEHREPGALFDSGRTVLVMAQDTLPSILNLTPDTPFESVLFPADEAGLNLINGRREKGVFLILDFIVARVSLRAERIERRRSEA